MKKSTINVIIAAIAAIVLGCVLVSGFQDRNRHEPERFHFGPYRMARQLHYT